jgi:hypothetical protein
MVQKDCDTLRLRKPIKWTPLSEKMVARETKRKTDEVQRQKVYRSYEYLSLESYKRYTNSGRLRLESMEGALRYFFEHSDMRLGHMQEKLINEIIVAFLPIMFGDDLVANLKFLTNKFNIKSLINTLGVLLPRRSGKTVACALIIAVIAVSQPDGNCIMYNLTAAQAEEFITEVIKYLYVFKDSPDYGWEVQKQDVRRMIRIKTRKFGTSNSIKSYACALKGDGKIDKKRCVCLFIYFFLFGVRGTRILFLKFVVLLVTPFESLGRIIFGDIKLREMFLLEAK